MTRSHDGANGAFFLVIGLSVLAMTSCATQVSSKISSEKQPTSEDERLVSEYACIGLPDGRKILLRYSVIDDVVRSLGEPSKKLHSAAKNWKDLWAYEYGDGDLIFVFENKDRRVIEIRSRIPGVHGSTFPFGLNRDSRSKTVALSFMSTPAISAVTLGDAFVGFALGELRQPQGEVRFDSQGSAYLYDVFYSVPWEGYGE